MATTEAAQAAAQVRTAVNAAVKSGKLDGTRANYRVRTHNYGGGSSVNIHIHPVSDAAAAAAWVTVGPEDVESHTYHMDRKVAPWVRDDAAFLYGLLDQHRRSNRFTFVYLGAGTVL